MHADRSKSKAGVMNRLHGIAVQFVHFHFGSIALHVRRGFLFFAFIGVYRRSSAVALF